MKPVNKKLSEIKPYFNNPRKIKNAIEPVAESIKRFGFKQPIVIDKDGTIVVGHVRYEAAKKLKLKSVPCIVAENLSDQEIRAYRLADNKTRELSEWNFDRLEYEYTRLVEDGFDFDGFGFDIDTDEVHEKENAVREQTIRDSEEIDLSDFDDEHFDYCCPKCGMRFNKK